MLHADEVYHAGIEAAEVEFLKAKRSGMVDPVVILIPIDRNDPRIVRAAACDREELAASLNRTCPVGAKVLREGPPADRPLTIVVATIRGIELFHRADPEADA